MCCSMRAVLLYVAVFLLFVYDKGMLEKKRKREKLLGSEDAVTNKRKAECMGMSVCVCVDECVETDPKNVQLG